MLLLQERGGEGLEEKVWNQLEEKEEVWGE